MLQIQVTCLASESQFDCLFPLRCTLPILPLQLGNFFTSLKLVDAFREYDSVFHLSRRKYIPPNFAELRHIVNIAQVG
jgi:IMP and pyridine-specific 5'-nucleotidase